MGALNIAQNSKDFDINVPVLISSPHQHQTSFLENNAMSTSYNITHNFSSVYSRCPKIPLTGKPDSWLKPNLLAHGLIEIPQ